ncbi:uncharacterized protein LOC111257079 [Setaria italica]|uniref:uncharacterized protein LOC111257079 n=1 Tax=Setaria italica TaxID=4555 RepID=UPI000BE58B42|nr:uncharacterized protein LOC111257079 [Setaria italica]
MDVGSSLNILYAKTLDAMGIARSRLCPNEAPFHGIVPGRRAMPLGQIDLPITVGNPSNFRKGTLTFEVLKMPRPNGIITVSTSFQKAYECDVECCEYIAAITASKDHVVQLAEDAKDLPDSK